MWEAHRLQMPVSGLRSEGTIEPPHWGAAEQAKRMPSRELEKRSSGRWQVTRREGKETEG